MFFGNILLAVAWAALQGNFSLSNLVIGYLLGYALLALLAHGGVLGTAYRKRVRAVLLVAWFLLREFLVANLKMAVDVARPRLRMTPGIVRVPLDATDEYEILLLSTLINLTPGSLCIDVSDDRKALYVHVMHISTPEAVRAEIKNHFERRVLEVWRGESRAAR